MEELTQVTPWKFWKWPLIGYIVLAIIVAFVYAGGDPEAQLPHQSGLLVAPIFLYLAGVSVATGWAPLRWGMTASRHQNPGVFWVVVSFHLLFAAAGLLMGFGVFERFR